VKCEVTIFVNDALDFIPEKLPACVFHRVRHGCRKHHGLFVEIAFDENTLDVIAERNDFEETVTLVKHELLNTTHIHLAHLDHAVQPARGGHQDVRFALQARDGVLFRNSSLETLTFDIQTFGESVELAFDLVR